MILFAFEFLLTNVIFSTILCAAFLHFKKEEKPSSLELLLYSLGLGPVFTTLLLYYFLLFLPHHSHLFYFLSIIFVYSILFTLGRRNFLVLWSDLAKKITDIKSSLKSLKTYFRVELIFFLSVFVLFLILFLTLYIPNTLQKPLDGTDVLKYGTLGKIFFSEKSLEFRWIRPYPKTGFYFDMNSGPSFSLLMTWERIMDSLFHAEKDLYYKSLSTYYALLILGVMLFWLSKKSKYLALVGGFALISGYAFSQTVVMQHLDSYRIFLIIISWIFLAYAIERKDVFSFLFLGIVSGFAAFSHTIGAILTAFNCLALFIFLKGSWKYKFAKTTLVILLTVVFGWLHYIIDIILGFGWILFNRSATFWG